MSRGIKIVTEMSYYKCFQNAVTFTCSFLSPDTILTSVIMAEYL